MSAISKHTLSVPLAIVSALCLSGPSSRALAQGAPPATRAAAAPLIEAARAAFEALPEADRKAIQEALIWTGDYSGAADGTFGRGTFDALAVYQQRGNTVPNGILTPSARTSLLAAAQQARTIAGFSVIDDPKSGVRIGVPAQVLPKQDVNANGGSRWQSADGKITLDTRIAPPDQTLQSLYERNLAIQTPGRVLSYKVLRPDFFVIAGETPTGKFYTRYAASPSGIRAFSIGYDKTLAPKVDRLVVAIANSFTPFPMTSPATASSATPAPTPTAQGKSVAANNGSLIGTGIAIGPRQVLTAAPLASCKDPRAGGLKPQQVAGNGPWVLTFAENLKATPASLSAGSTMAGASLLVVSFASDNGQISLNATPASALDEASLAAPLQPGASGAPVLDPSGSLIGLVGNVSSDGRRIAGIMPVARYPMLLPAKFTDVAPTLAAKAAEPATQKRAADLAAGIAPALVPIQCAP
ncbi:peptidoglycan-binding protein [Microvirga flavescens]|uniref:peptidoglycan-binding protein n=1 Tax=Microvirga flavescens TaxID=2249811 RepID=UPI000DD65441|nr:peptidoglycan-binding protein [Microvirga flavescens]